MNSHEAARGREGVSQAWWRPGSRTVLFGQKPMERALHELASIGFVVAILVHHPAVIPSSSTELLLPLCLPSIYGYSRLPLFQSSPACEVLTSGLSRYITLGSCQNRHAQSGYQDSSFKCVRFSVSAAWRAGV